MISVFRLLSPCRATHEEEPTVPQGISPELREFMRLCWKKVPLQRATARELLRHPFLTLRHSSSQEHSPDRHFQVRLERLGDASLEKMASSLSIANSTLTKQQSRTTMVPDAQLNDSSEFFTASKEAIGFAFDRSLDKVVPQGETPLAFAFGLLAGEDGKIAPKFLRHLLQALGYLIPEHHKILKSK
jgi:hypothetical protein